MNYTELEMKVAAALFESSEGNGHDFGFSGDAAKCVENPRQLAGIMSSLVKKGVVTVYEPVTVQTGHGNVTYVQFVFNVFNKFNNRVIPEGTVWPTWTLGMMLGTEEVK